MGRNPTKAAGNIYCQCRKEAAKMIDKLNSREGASEALFLSVSTLTDYELDNTRPPVETVARMADLYHTPELLNHYCTHDCPIGRRNVPRLEVSDLDRLTVKLIAAFRQGRDIQDVLLEITEDGVITEKEKPKLEGVLRYLDNITQVAGELRLWVEKNL